MLYGDGSGSLCTIETVGSDNLVTADSVRALAEGMVVDFCSSTGAIIASARGRKILKIDRENKTFSVDGAAISAETVPAGSKVALQNSYGYEITGLGALFSDSGTLYGVDREEHPWLKPYIKEEVGTISENIVQTAIDTIEENSGGKVNFIVCSWGVKRALAEFYTQYRTFMPTEEILGGYKALIFNGIPVVADRFCPEGTMYLLNTEDFCLHSFATAVAESEDGKILKQTSRKPVYTQLW